MEEIDIYGSALEFDPVIEDYLEHYGMKYRSGRYPYGSGEDPYQHSPDFLATVKEYKDSGMTEKEIATAMHMSIAELRARKSAIQNAERQARYCQAVTLKDKGYSTSAIAREMGINESSVRTLLDPHIKYNQDKLNNTIDILKQRVEEDKYIDIGVGNEMYLEGISRTKFETAVQSLLDQGYTKHYVKTSLLNTPGKQTETIVLAAPGVPYKEVIDNLDNIHGVVETTVFSEDGARSSLGIREPTSVDSSRLTVRYAEDGGVNMDGVIELRPGVNDLDLCGRNYAQVRIAVDGTHYLKGMAVYSDDLPPGIDIRFNTNKTKDVPMLGPKSNSVLKPLKSDPENPFGSLLKIEDGAVVGQREYIDIHGEKQLSPINVVREEGDWDGWSKTLSSQFLSKQYPATAKRQLDITYQDALDQFEEVKSLTNPEVKRALLDKLAESYDSDAVSLKAASFPRQSTKVILPITTLKDNEAYCPTLQEGEQVALVRYPYGGTFEMPLLTVTHNNKDAQKMIGNDSLDAIGINAQVASRMSGADFDGDTCVVIPVTGQNIKTSAPLPGLEGFDPKDKYRGYPGMKVIKAKTKQTEMGKISNLITDMTIKGATSEELERAVRHSMVIIDAEKHELNYKQSYADNDIASLKIKYQGGEKRGASTLISRASSEIRIDEQKEKRIGSMTPEEYERYKNGEKIYEKTGETYTQVKYKKVVDPVTGKKATARDEDGNPIVISKKEGVVRQQITTRMANTNDARTLISESGSAIEEIYADYANKMKTLANTARKEALGVPYTSMNSEAKKRYSNEVSSLMAKLNEAQKNKPLERRAQLIANKWYKDAVKDNPDMETDEKKKRKVQYLTEARIRVGSGKSRIDISDKEWEAIQSGAISSSKLRLIFSHMDADQLRKLAMPKAEKTGLTTQQETRVRNLVKNGYTINEIASVMDISTSSVSNYIGKIKSKQA